MASDTTVDASALLEAAIKIPQHVVYRSFPAETVVLNLQTGKYHGLNATAGRMLEILEKAACVREAAVELAQVYGQPTGVVEQHLCDLCQALLERGLIELDGDGGPSR